MAYDESAWRDFVAAYDIEVPDYAIQREIDYIELQMRHNMQYDTLSGGGSHMFPDQELEQQRDQIRAAALFEAKEPLVLKDLIAKQGFTVTDEELEAEAEAMAKRQGSTVEQLKRFFGEDLRMLERDVMEAKARAWAVG